MTARSVDHEESQPTISNPAITSLHRTASTESTLYPKISGDFRQLLKNINRHYHSTGATPADTLSFTGTVKLHGTHADIRVYPSGRLAPQSRNNADLSPDKDNLGFAQFCAEHAPAIRELAARIHQRWRELHPDSELPEGVEEEDAATILAGEWVGSGIQRAPATALAGLSRRFVLCSVRVAGRWEPPEHYAGVADDARAHLYSIARGGLFTLTLALADSGAAFLDAARRLTDAVCARCPFGAAMGVEGRGEGIVWTPAAGAELPNGPAFWLKTKGADFMGTPKKGSGVDPAKRVQADEKAAAARAFAHEACHERRLEQGWDYLREMHVERDMKGLGVFMSWVMQDIEVEEANDIVELQLTSLWKREAGMVAKEWYIREVEAGTVRTIPH